MNGNRKYLLGFLIASVLIYQIVFLRSVDAVKFAGDGAAKLQTQIVPTATQLVPTSQEIPTTDPVLLQVIIGLGVFMVLIIFFGVWINRRQVEIK